MSLHHKLTADHFELNPASKMRNHLAEDVLDKNMLELMEVTMKLIYNNFDFSYIQLLFITTDQNLTQVIQVSPGEDIRFYDYS